MKRIPVASLALATLACLPAGAATPEDSTDAGWVPLFDGQTLEGWQVKCWPRDEGKHYWKVEDGAIEADVPEGSDHQYIRLVRGEAYADFELKLKVQTFAARPGNSGIQVRSRYDDEARWMDGPQVDINPPGPWRNGFIYDETREIRMWISPIIGPASFAKPDQAVEGWAWEHAGEDDTWNDVHITCRGARIRKTWHPLLGF